MKNLLNESIGKIQKSRKIRHRRLAAFLVLAVFVTMGVNWGLSRDGAAMSEAEEYICGLSVHSHGSDCYTEVLACGLEETEEEPAHSHSASCYARELTCTLPEHTHSESCVKAKEAEPTEAPAEEPTAEPTAEVTAEPTAEVTAEPTQDADTLPSEDGLVPNDEDEAILPVANGDGVDMDGYVTKVVFSKKVGSVYEESTEFTTGDQVRANLSFARVEKTALQANANTIYIDLPAYIDCSQFVGSFEAYDGGVQSGNYSYRKNADGSYTIVLVLLDDYVANAGDYIGGSLTFDFNWTGDAVPDEGGKTTIKIGSWTGDVTITDDSTPGGYAIAKTADSLSFSDDGKQAYIDYTVTLTVGKNTAAPISLSDVLTGAGFEFDTSKGLTLQKDGSSSDHAIKFANAATSDTGASADIVIGSSGETIAKGTYTIKYRVKSTVDVSDPAVTVPSSVGNKVTAPGDDNPPYAEAWQAISTGTISKSGEKSEDADGNTYINYTIYLNKGDVIKNLKTPAVFSDELPDTLILDGDVTVKQYDPSGKLISTSTASVDGQNLSYTTPTGAYYYEITYRTKVDASKLSMGDNKIHNTAKSTGGIEGSSRDETTVSVGVVGKDYVSHKLSETESGWINTVKWKTSINVSGSLEGYTYEDYTELFSDSNGNQFSAMTMTDAQRSAIVVKDANGNVVSSSKYTVEESDETGWHSDIVVGLFKLTFTDAVEGPVTIEYETMTDMSRLKEGDYYTFKNIGELSKDGKSDVVRAQTPSILYRTEDSSYIHKYGKNYTATSKSDKITIGSGENTVPWSILVNEGRTMSSDLTVTDVISDGMTLDTSSLKIEVNGGNFVNQPDYVTWSYENNVLTIHIKANTYSGDNYSSTITISYKTILPDDFLKGGETEKAFKNSATVEFDGTTSKSTFTHNVTREVIDKEGDYDSSTKMLTYNIYVNAGAATLLDGKTLTITDTLASQSSSHADIMEYITLESLQLFTIHTDTNSKGDLLMSPGRYLRDLTEVSSGSKQFTYTWDESSKTFVTHLPDSTAYCIVAKYSVGVDVAESMHMKNTVRIEGNDNWKKDESSTQITQKTSAETYTEKDTVTIIKHDSENYEKLLKGAEFELTKYVDNAWTTEKTMTTNSKGIASAEDVSYLVLYKLVETKAPSGYVLDDTPVYFIIARESDAGKAKDNLPDSISGEASYSKSAVTVYTTQDNVKDESGNITKEYYANVRLDRYNRSEDTPEYGTLDVTKQWLDASGNVVTDTDDMPDVFVTLTMHQDGTDTVIGRVRLGSDNNWTYSWSGLDISDGTTYTLTETTVDGYTASYELDGEALAAGATFTVTAAGNAVTVCNRPQSEGETGSIKVDKIWIDSHTNIVTDTSEMPAVTVTLTKHQDGAEDEIIGTAELNQKNNWAYTWENLDISDGVTYSVIETTMDGYSASYKVDDVAIAAGTAFAATAEGTHVAITNTATPKGQLQVKKIWVDAQGNVITDETTLSNMPEVEITLKKFMPAKDPVILETVKLNAENDWSYSWDNLDISLGETYSVVETVPEGYTVSYGLNSLDNIHPEDYPFFAEATGTSFYVINTAEASETGKVQVNKIWQDSEGNVMDDTSALPSVEVTLTKHQDGAEDEVISTVTLNQENNWASVWENLDISEGVTYTLTETAVDGYSTTYTLNNEALAEGTAFAATVEGVQVTVTNTAEGPAGSLQVTKKWIDNAGNEVTEAQDLAGKPAVEVTLTKHVEGQDDVIVSAVTLNQENAWTYTWENLDISEGVTYSLTETALDGYTVSYQLGGEALAEGTAFTVTAEGSAVTVINQDTASYNLPQTGGAGTVMLTVSGVVLMLGAMLGILLKRKLTV